jgi:hypothetical protein
VVSIVWSQSPVLASGRRHLHARASRSASERGSAVSRRPLSQWQARICASSLLAGWLVVTADFAQGAPQQDLLLRLSNPLSGLARVSADFDEDRDIGEHEEGSLRALQLRPVLGMAVNRRFGLISDTIVSTRDERFARVQSRHTVVHETLSLVPLRVHASGFQWATGAAGRFEEGGKWGIGPSVTLVQRDDNEISGLTLRHLWSTSEDHGDLSTIDAFTTWTRNGSGLTLRLEASYDERTREMLMPVALELRRMFNTSSVGLAVDLRTRYYVDAPGSTGRWGAGVGFTFSSLR